jgi:hypothetical protein
MIAITRYSPFLQQNSPNIYMLHMCHVVLIMNRLSVSLTIGRKPFSVGHLTTVSPHQRPHSFGRALTLPL